MSEITGGYNSSSTISVGEITISIGEALCDPWDSPPYITSLEDVEDMYGMTESSARI